MQQDVGTVVTQSKLECVNPATGKALWSGTLPMGGAKFYASPVAADGKLYLLRNDGQMTVAGTQPGADGAMTVLSVNTVVDPAAKEEFNASPVPVGGRILIRGERNLYCVGDASIAHAPVENAPVVPYSCSSPSVPPPSVPPPSS